MPETTVEIKHPKRRYNVQGRNGYYGIDEYTVNGCMRNVDSFKTQKQANLTAGHLSGAYYDGMKDALVGFKLPLRRECKAYIRAEKKDIVVKAGEMVTVVGRDSSAWFQVVTDDGREFSVQYADLREDPLYNNG